VARVVGARVLFRDGLPVATSVAGEVELLVPADAAATRSIAAVLRQGPTGNVPARSVAMSAA
jgi:ATP-dependent Lhr-like helicase